MLNSRGECPGIDLYLAGSVDPGGRRYLIVIGPDGVMFGRLIHPALSPKSGSSSGTSPTMNLVSVASVRPRSAVKY